MSLLRLVAFLFGLMILGGVVGTGAMIYAINYYSHNLPDHTQLLAYQPKVTTRLHAGDGRLLAEYAKERRLFVPVSSIPQQTINAFLAAEDQRFYEHHGIDFMGVARAIANIVKTQGRGRVQGASTITQQVAKNMLLSNERKIERKIKEAILSYRIEKTLGKERILELYLNQIFLGNSSYGIAAASLAYFDKSLDDLTIAQSAYLAALPKAPSNYHPVKNPGPALARRNWVIGRMAEEGFISAEEAKIAKSEELKIVRPKPETLVRADYFAEEVRRELVALFGEEPLYEGGLSVRTTINPLLQQTADRLMAQAMEKFDRKRGYRGVLVNVAVDPSRWPEQLSELAKKYGIGRPSRWPLAMVLNVVGDKAELGLLGGQTANLGLEGVKWAAPAKGTKMIGPAPKRVSDVVKNGDVILVELVNGQAQLRQMPLIQGGLVAMDPHTGRVLAMVGGFSFGESSFNRATQAKRQPGSSFKPIVYLTALENGFTPSSKVVDGPFVIDQGPGLGLWQPQNYSADFLGPTTLRVGMEKSRNLMTVRLAQSVGMNKIVDYARRLGVDEKMQPVLSMSLGAGETTVLKMVTAYSMMVNGGKKIVPSLIDRVQDSQGLTVFKHDERLCEGCKTDQWANQPPPILLDTREQVITPQGAYQMVNILTGVVQRGTAAKVAVVGKPLAGKTGTTNDSKDVWFVGFSPDLAVGLYFGYDQPESLGQKETGGGMAAPVFRDFMQVALKDQPATPFRVPPGLSLVRVNPATGRPAEYGEARAIWEAYLPGTEPGDEEEAVLDGSLPGYDGSGTLPDLTNLLPVDEVNPPSNLAAPSLDPDGSTVPVDPSAAPAVVQDGTTPAIPAPIAPNPPKTTTTAPSSGAIGGGLY